VGRSEDPYQEIIDSDVDLDDWYEEHQTRLVTELQEAVRPAPSGKPSSLVRLSDGTFQKDLEETLNRLFKLEGFSGGA